MTGRRGLISRMRSKASSPDMSPRRTSRMTASGPRSRTRSRPRPPLRAVRTSSESERRLFSIEYRTLGSSSTTSSVGMAIPSVRGPRPADREDRPRPAPILRGDTSGVGLDDALADRQAQAHPRLLGADERLEDLRPQPGRQPGAAVADPHRQPRPASRPGLDADGAAGPRRLQGVEQQVEQHLAELPHVGLQQQAGARIAVDPRPLALGPGGHQADGLQEHRAGLEPPRPRLRRPGEIEERLHQVLQAGDLFLDDGQVAAGQLASLPRRRGLDQEFHRHQGVAQLVGQAGGELARGGQLLGPQGVALRPLQPVDDHSHPLGDGAQDRLQVVQAPARREGDGPDDVGQPAGGVADGDAELHQGAVDDAGDAEARQHAGRGAAEAQQHQAQGDAAGHALVVGAALGDGHLVDVQVFLGGVKDVARQDLGEQRPQPLGDEGVVGSGLELAQLVEEVPIAFLDLADQFLFGRRQGEPVGDRQPGVRLGPQPDGGPEVLAVARQEVLVQLGLDVPEADLQLLGRADAGHVLGEDVRQVLLEVEDVHRGDHRHAQEQQADGHARGRQSKQESRVHAPPFRGPAGADQPPRPRRLYRHGPGTRNLDRHDGPRCRFPLAVHSRAWHLERAYSILLIPSSGGRRMKALPLGVTPRQGLLALTAGLLGAAAFWPLSLWPLMLVSVAFFLRLLRDQDGQTARNIGLVYGLALCGGTMYWMFGIFGVLAVPLLAITAAYFGLLAALFAMTRGLNAAARVGLVARFAVAVEWLRGDAWYLRFPWYTPLHALAAAPPMIAGVRWLGTYGLSFVIWLIAAAGAFRPRAYAAFLLLPACWLLLPPPNVEPVHRALLLQTEMGSIEQLISTVPEETIDLAVLPEYAYTRSPEAVLSGRNGPAALARKTSAPVVFGAVEGTYGVMPFSNVAAVVGPDGQLLGTFPKQRPVPLMADGTPGERRPVFAVEQGVLGVAVCYDFDAPFVAGDLVNAGATVLVAPTMDRMEWGWVEHEHHALLFRLRAVENDRWLVRASSSGRSEVISPDGMASSGGIEIGKEGHVVLSFEH